MKHRYGVYSDNKLFKEIDADYFSISHRTLIFFEIEKIPQKFLFWDISPYDRHIEIARFNKWSSVVRKY